ncbi:hypothetical protein NE172_10945 [Clostridium botulinum]|uniref:Holin n=1 Tax=Clostridium botulinum TaxID=1491 RepID=A0A6B4JP45_CLOBO|nr:hypothetical protein [Clostridium botulinum]EES47862.1 hypothetical protein CLO_1867 [Clostridium botulinum E1 str. 'BoNT E Beluga']MBY6761848.1 hypothetical protein [Clostridium botulinum]MBY6920774.1 hypothetical protein [Clostridium botulinum]MCR1131478.1 hypothetical protein [Clostridium botulinum]NFJ58617.1 hypothetical protein [Clostridium botulinum]
MKNTELIERLKNPGTIITLVSLVILVLTTNGVLVDNERVMTTVQAFCSIGVILGVLNNPGTDGVDLPFIKSNKENNKQE